MAGLKEEIEKKKQENILRTGSKFQKITNPKTLQKISKSKQGKLLKAVTSSPSLDDDDDWEICNDEGFIYKRRRRQDSAAELRPPSPAPADAEADLRRRQRSRRRRCLLGLREKYMIELEQWESLSSALHRLTTTTAPSASAAASESSFSPPTHPWTAEVGSTQTLIDDLLSQVEAQETVLKKLSEICDYVELVCKKQEESLMESLLELPIWGSPQCLMVSLSS